MSRSKFKGPVISLLTEHHSKKIKYIFSKYILILPEHIDQIFKIYNGKKFIILKVTESMVGRRFGEFVYTRASYQYKKKNKK